MTWNSYYQLDISEFSLYIMKEFILEDMIRKRYASKSVKHRNMKQFGLSF